MKKFLPILSALILGATTYAQTTDDDASRQALCGALEQVGVSLRSAPFGKKTIAILPVKGEAGEMLSGRLKTLVTEAGFTCVEGKDDPMWEKILEEMAWNERKEDLLDQTTLVKFGKLKGAQILLYGAVRSLSKNAERVYAEVELHATDIATRRHIWGGNFADRFYCGADIQGVVSLDNDIRTLLKKNFEQAERSLTSPEFALRLSGVKSVTVIPLAGDIDYYTTGLAIEMFTRTSIVPKNSQIPSLSQARAFVRDGQIDSDAIFYGAVRDLSRKVKSEEIKGDKNVVTCTLQADIQLFLEQAKSGAILWSKTITLAENQAIERALALKELEAERKTRKAMLNAKLEDAPDEVKAAVANNWKRYVKYAGIGIGGIILLFVLVKVLEGWVSNFHMR